MLHFVYPVVDGHLSFHILAVVSCIAVNITSICLDTCCQFGEYIPRRRIAESGNSVSVFLRNCCFPQ